LILTDANNCRTEDTVVIGYNYAFEDFDAQASETRVFDGHEVTLSATEIEDMTYSWTPAENLRHPYAPTTSATMYQTTLFYVTASDGYGCETKDSVLVEVDFVNCDKPNIYVPNVFTPNNDGKNDKVFVSGDWIGEITFEIYDRWGEKVFATNDIAEGWDGTFNGNLCDAAVYFYKLEVKCMGGKTYIGGGDITLIR
jgi:gliding motility-associated-like protein